MTEYKVGQIVETPEGKGEIVSVRAWDGDTRGYLVKVDNGKKVKRFVFVVQGEVRKVE